MSLYIPVYNKMKYAEGVTVERSLPSKGEIVVKKGDKVVPFTKVGRAKVSKESFYLPDNIKITKGKEDGAFFYEGEKVGKSGFKKINAPYNGYISKEDNQWKFNQEKKDVWLLAGVWGIVDEVVGNVSASIRTQTVNINFIAYSSKILMGELIVFPNPSELLDTEYLQNFSNNIQNKIIYVGHHIRKEVYDMALDLGVGGLIAGSVDKDLYTYSKSMPVPVAIMTGFGKLTTPIYMFEFLKTISNRHVFIDGQKGQLQVPVPIDNRFEITQTPGALREVQPGLSVLIFDKLNFGLTGEVESVQDESIYVKLNKSDDIVETQVPNIFALV